MSGICGIVAPHSRAPTVTEARVRLMGTAQRHRGPTGLETWAGCGVALAWQGAATQNARGVVSDGRHRMVLDGRVRTPLSRGEAADGSGERSNRSEAEGLLSRFVARGTAGLARLDGAFAFAAWDDEARRLVLARDRLGARPLYYVHASDGTLYFASEIKALLAVEAVRPSLNHAALPDYLNSGAPTGEATLFEGVQRLPPGHALIWQDGLIRMERCGTLSLGGRPTIPREELVGRFADDFRAAVRRALVGNGPFGVLLTGGLESAAVAAAARAEAGSSVRAFHWSFAGGPDRGTGLVVTPELFVASLPEVVWHEDEPLASPVNVALFRLYDRAAQHVSTVLSGVGGEELVGGGHRHRRLVTSLRIASAYRRLGIPAFEPKGRARRNGGDRLPRWRGPRAMDSWALYLEGTAIFRAEEQARLLTPECRERVAAGIAHGWLEEALESSGARNLLDALLGVDLHVRLHERLMVHDQASKASSVEHRMPFLERPIVDLATRLPARLKLRRPPTAQLLARSLGDLLPAQSAGTGVEALPLARWFRAELRPLVHEYVLSNRTLARGLFQSDAVGQLVAAHESRRADHSARLWSLINLEIWQRLFVDGETVAADAPRVATASG
jgi:asparagine synthase (glutamine-hydrolysing)